MYVEGEGGRGGNAFSRNGAVFIGRKIRLISLSCDSLGKIEATNNRSAEFHKKP